MTGAIVLVAALVLTGGVALLLEVRNGRFATADGPSADEPLTAGAEVLSPADIGTDLGGRATLVQFSSAFYSPCRATRTLLTDVAGRLDDVAYVDVDAESHLDLVRRLDVRRTPTVLVLDPRGFVVRRASGLPRREQVLAALADV